MLQTLPSAGRNVFFASTMTPTVVYTGDRQYARQQDQSNSSLISLGGGPRRNNNYLLDGVPIVDLLNRATFIPSMLAVEEMRVQLSATDAEIGLYVGWGLQCDGQVRLERLARRGSLRDPSERHARTPLFRREERHPESAHLLSPRGRFRRRAGVTQSHVLLRQHRRLPDIDDEERRARASHGGGASWRLLAVRRDDLRPDHHEAGSGATRRTAFEIRFLAIRSRPAVSIPSRWR